MVHHLSRIEEHQVHHHIDKPLHCASREPPTGTSTTKLIVTRTQDTPSQIQFSSKETLPLNNPPQEMRAEYGSSSINNNYNDWND